MTAEQLREAFDIKCDFTPEEEKQVKKLHFYIETCPLMESFFSQLKEENAWAFSH